MKNIFKTVIMFPVLCSFILSENSQEPELRTPEDNDASISVQVHSSVHKKDLPIFYNVRDFGAKGDSLAFDTEAINRAIDTAASKGGGTIWFPAGKYLSFSIRLKSNITIFLDNGAILIAADPNQGKGGYDAPEPNTTDMYQDFGHSHWHNSLIWGENIENIAITGQGWIIGTNGLTREGRRNLLIRQLR